MCMLFIILNKDGDGRSFEAMEYLNIQKRRSSFMTQNNNNLLGMNVIKHQREDESIYKKTDDSFDINESPFKK